MPIILKEKDIARTCGDYLELDGWRLLWCEPMSRPDLGKGFGEPGMPDLLCLRYEQSEYCDEWGDILWIEFKRRGGRLSQKQRDWHIAERARRALTLIMGEDCEASIDGWLAWYRASGLNRGRV